MVIVYLRVSTDKQETNNQKFETNIFCKKRGFIVDVWIEETISGTKDIHDRKIWPAIKKLKLGDTLVVAEISRIGRNLFHIMEVMKYCLDNGISIFTVKEGYVLENNIQAKVMAFAFGIAAEIERNLLSQRIKEALARKKSEGMILGRPIGSRKKNPILKKHHDFICNQVLSGASQISIAKKLKVHRHTVKDYIYENFQ